MLYQEINPGVSIDILYATLPAECLAVYHELPKAFYARRHKCAVIADHKKVSLVCGRAYLQDIYVKLQQQIHIWNYCDPKTLSDQTATT